MATRDGQATRFSQSILHVMILASGAAALSWEVLWQLHSSLALGVSALGTALTLASTIGGMSVGSLLMGRYLKAKTTLEPLWIYGLLEITIGLAGLGLPLAFQQVSILDQWIYRNIFHAYSFLHILSIVAVLGVPTLCMGATFPVFGLIARQHSSSVATLYGLNTLGAAGGTLIIAFSLIPMFGLLHASWIAASINILIGVCAIALQKKSSSVFTEPDVNNSIKSLPSGLSPATEILLVAVTGFATFALEIAWFRMLTAAFRSTTDVFAVMLACMLLALGLAGRITPYLRKHNPTILGSMVAISGSLILLATPLIERFDLIDSYFAQVYLVLFQLFFMTLIVIGPPIFLLGIGLPWVMDSQQSPRRWSLLYTTNTLFSIVGAIGAAWVLLPTIGAVRTAWLAGGIIGITGFFLTARKWRFYLVAILMCSIAVAAVFQSGIGTLRVQGFVRFKGVMPDKILESYEGPEATVTAIEWPNNHGRALVIDGFVAASQFDQLHTSADTYMAWMGHLPMLLHPNPQQALVICFGTGQTVNAVRKENPVSVDLVDINPRVLKLGHNFDRNENVLADPRVHPTIMDGRAYMRRVQKTYDVITLEPMPPSFAGVNALYSKEFYELAYQHLTSDGIVAQWIPFHLESPHYTASIIRTFRQVFPNSFLWIDPASTTGILLGTKNSNIAFGKSWPGFARNPILRGYSEDAVLGAILMDKDQLKLFDQKGEVVTDDNQLLAYGEAVLASHFSRYLLKDTLEYIGFKSPMPSTTEEKPRN